MPDATNHPRPLILMILDGYGISFVEEGNAIKTAKQPNMDRYMREYPLAAIHAAGIEVGLPWGEMGNSETGHQNIGSGRVLYQNLPRITMAIQDKSFFKNPAFLEAAEHVKQNKQAALHIIGLLSNGGIHSHIDHQLALLKFAHKQKIGKRTYIHAFLDGRDSPPESADNFVNQLMEAIKKTRAGTLATMIGRYYAMDRNNHWDRVQVAYDLLVNGKGETYKSWKDAVQAAFKNADTKSFETAPAVIISEDDSPPRTIQDGDAVIFYNYRPDRAQQLTAAFTLPDFSDFATTKFKNLKFVTMAEYNETLPVSIAFPKETITNPLGLIISQAGLTQLRIAEGEKYAHVTHFFDGGDDTKYPGQKRIKIKSVDTKDFSKHPHMSAEEITDRTIKEIQGGKFDIIIMNFANPDMVAHTGKFNATVKALEFLDEQIGRVTDAALAAGGSVLLTCDHGNAEVVVSQLTHKRTTDHTNSPVPLIYIAPNNKLNSPKDADTLLQILSNPIGVLADVAPTTLEILEIKPPPEMTAQSLLPSLS